MAEAKLPDLDVKTTAIIAEDILLALLAVNAMPLQRVYAIREQLLEAGLLDFAAVAKLSVPEVTQRLVAAGYDRRRLTALIADRVRALAAALTDEELRKIADDVNAGRRSEVNATLSRLRGVGPFVLESFWLLQDAEPHTNAAKSADKPD